MKLIAKIALVLGVCAVGWFVWWVWIRSEKDQILAAQEKFFAEIEDRDFDGIKAMLAPDYLDDYGHNRDSAAEDAERALAGFIQLEVKRELVSMRNVPGLGELRMKIQLEGRGFSPINTLVIGRVNLIQTPWFFHWRKYGPWPWSWKVTQVHNDELRIPQF